jgi:hypothetical protein
MASGALTLIEAAKAGTDQKKRGVVETIIQESPIIEMVPWLTISGTAFKQTVEDTLPNVQFRAVNGSYTRSFGTDTERYWGVTILGGEYAVDPFLVDVIASDGDLRAKQVAKLAKANAMRFDFEAINGTGASNGFKGWKQLISEGLGQSYANSATGATVNLDKLDEAHDLFRNQGGAHAMLLNRTARRQITKAARTSVTGVSLIDVGTDVFGRQVTSWNDIPMRILGDVIDGSGNVVDALPFNEDPGDGTFDCTSIYFAKFGEDDVAGLMGKGGSFQVKDFGELETQPQLMGRLEWYPGMAVFNSYSLVRLTGITAA